MTDIRPILALTEYRMRHKPYLSMDALAEKLGVSTAAICRWESGERKVKPTLAPKISAATGIPLHVLRPDVYPKPRKEK